MKKNLNSLVEVSDLWLSRMVKFASRRENKSAKEKASEKVIRIYITYTYIKSDSSAMMRCV